VSQGCCKIDDFTGRQLLRVLYDIINMENENGDFLYGPGNVVYFSKNESFCAAIMFTKSKPLITTPPKKLAKKDENMKYKHLYSKLFHDNYAEKFSVIPNKYREYYSENYVKEMREKAFVLFPTFLTNNIGCFELYPYGYKFLTVLVPIAYGIGRRGNPQSLGWEIDFSVPYAACLKFAFSKKLTGKIAGLCGEVGYKPENVSINDRIKITKEKTRDLIER